MILEGLENSKLGYSVEFEDIVDGGYECIWDMYKESMNDYNFFLTEQTIGIIVQTIQTNGSYIAVDYSYDWKNLRKQHSCAEIEIVAWDGSMTILISKNDDIIDRIKNSNPMAEDLEKYNTQELE